MKLTILILLSAFVSFSQKELKDYSLNHSLKQDNEQLQFKVLDTDDRGIWMHRKNRFYFWYKSQKVISTQGGSSGQLLHGNFESFYDNKQISKKGKFHKGLKTGEWLYWRMDGTLIRTEHWKKGRLAELRNTYDVDGSFKNRIEYKRNATRFENPDSIVIEKLNSHKKTVYLKDVEGNVKRKESFKNNALHGWVKNYEKAKVVSKTKYKNGTVTRGSDGEKSGFLKKLFKRKDKSENSKDKSEDSKDPKKSKEEKNPDKKVKNKKEPKESKKATEKKPKRSEKGNTEGKKPSSSAKSN
jgi:antitoxin component YwqK of YwqJK toxin-antitoxin module